MKKGFVYLLLFPGVVFLVIFVIAPLFATILTTFRLEESFTIESYRQFFTDPYYLKIYMRTLRTSLIATILCVILGFPTAYYISKTSMKKKGIYIALAVFPLLTSPVVRSFSWMAVLGRHGILNKILVGLNLVESPIRLLYTETAIIIGLVHLFLPLMILSLVGVMENIEGDLVRAAESLGASKLQAFLKVVVPLSVPGLLVGSILVLTGSLTAYTTPQLLGGSRTNVLATLIYQNAMTLNDWHTASVVATIMIVTTIAVIGIMNTAAKKLNPKG
ncbi:MAG: ABC transporter permease [Bacillota bacterium]